MKTLQHFNILIRKSLICSLALFTFSAVAYAQNPNSNPNAQAPWKLNGSQADTTQFVGTINNVDLVFKRNNIEGLRLLEDNNTRFSGNVFLDKLKPITPLPPDEIRVVTADNNGKLTSLDKSGLISAIYQPPQTCKTDGNGNILSVWKQLPNLDYGILYTGVDCPARVGIGTDNPRATLEVNGNGLFTKSLQVRTNQTKFIIGSAAGEPLGWGTSYIGFNAERIGDATHLWQTSSDGAHNGGSVIYGDIFGSIIFSTIPFTGNTNQTTISDATVKANTRLFIHRDGNVGIGTTAVNGAKLSVEGIIRARRVNVDAAGIVWSDFVFESNYNLMSLMDLERFIVKNKHLPDVPSATEVAANGVDLAQMDAILLQKIEELTLYIIDLEKKINELENEVV